MRRHAPGTCQGPASPCQVPGIPEAPLLPDIPPVSWRDGPVAPKCPAPRPQVPTAPSLRPAPFECVADTVLPDLSMSRPYSLSRFPLLGNIPGSCPPPVQMLKDGASPHNPAKSSATCQSVLMTTHGEGIVSFSLSVWGSNHRPNYCP